MLTLLAIFLAAYLGVRMADSPIGLLGEMRTLVEMVLLLPSFLWHAARGTLPTEADVQHARIELEALSLARMTHPPE